MICESVVNKIRTHVEKGIFCKIKEDDDIVTFSKSYPKLYDMVTSDKCDNNMLRQFLELSTKVREGKMKQKKGDELFGQIAAEKYVFPLTKTE